MASNSSGIKLGRAYVLIDAVDRTKQACNAALRNIATLADNVMAIGTNMTIGATIAVTLDASASRAFREFEDTMLKVKAKSKDTAGATVAAYDQLIQKAQELGRVTRFTAPQVAEAMAGMAAAGLSRSTIDKSIKNVLDLAIATGVEIPTASRIAMAAMQQFNMTAEQSAEICDVLSASVNNSALNLEDIGETFKYAAPLAKEFGMDIKQLSVAVAALGNAGIKGSQAGTSLRLMMTRLAKPSGYDLEKFNKEFEANVQRDVVVNVGGTLRKRTRPVLDILRDMGKAMDDFEKKHPDIDPQKKLSVFYELFGRVAMTSGSTLSDHLKNLDTMMRAINNSSGTAGKTAEIMDSGIGGMHAAFKSAWENVAIEYGKALNDTVKTFYTAFTRIAHVVSSFIQNNKRIISIATASTAATAGIGVAMMTSAAAVKTFAVVGGTFTSVIGTMTSAAYGFAIALNGWLNPLVEANALLRTLTGSAMALSVPIRSFAGVIGSFAPRFNLPWQAAPVPARMGGNRRLATRLLNRYYASQLDEMRPDGTRWYMSRWRAQEQARLLRHSLTPEGRLESLDSRVRANPQRFLGNVGRRDILRRVEEARIELREASMAQRMLANLPVNQRTADYADRVRAANERVTNAYNARYAAEEAMRANRRQHLQFLRPQFLETASLNQNVSPRALDRLARDAALVTRNNDFAGNAQYARERIRLLRRRASATPFRTLLTDSRASLQGISGEIVATRRLATMSNMRLGAQRWERFFNPFITSIRRATIGLRDFAQGIAGSIRMIGLHPIQGMRSMLGLAGSSLFAGLAPGGGIMKGIGAMFSATFKAIRAMGMPILRGMFNLVVRIATAPLTWVAGLTAATLATGNLKNVLAGVYIGISAIGVGISKIYEQAKKVFSWIAERFVENMKQANAIIDPVLNLWKTSFVRIGSDVKSSFGTITRSIGAGRWGDAFKMLGATWRVIRAELTAVLRANWEHMKLTFMTTWNRVVDYFQSGEGVWGVFKWLIKSLRNVTKYAVSGLYNAITTFWSGQIQIGNVSVRKASWFNTDQQLFEKMFEIASEYSNQKVADKFDYKDYPEFARAMRAHNTHTLRSFGGNLYDNEGALSRESLFDELNRMIAQAQIDINGKDIDVPTPENGFGWKYGQAVVDEQKKIVAALSNSAGNIDVSNDAGAIAAREALKETQKEMEGNVERQRAAEAEAALKEREEAVLKEFGEEGVGKIAKALEGFYNLDAVSANRRRGMIAAAGEYITKMGMSIEQFEKVINTLVSMFGAGKGNAGWFSESSNIERYANLANPVIAKAMQLLGDKAFSGGFSFSYADKNGDRINKTLARTKDGKELTQFEQLQELAQVLNTLSPTQAQDVRKQFVAQYGEPATAIIENALDAMVERNTNLDFTEEERLYRHNTNGTTEFDKLSEYEKNAIDDRLKTLMPDDLNLSEKNRSKLMEAIAKETFGKSEEGSVATVVKVGDYKTAFGGSKEFVDAYIPEKQKMYAMPEEIGNAWGQFTRMQNQGIAPDENKFVDMLIKAGEVNEILRKNGESTYGGEVTAGFAMLRHLEDRFNTKELDRKMRFYGINTEGMSTADKLGVLKEKEGESAVTEMIRRDVGKAVLASNGGDMKGALEVVKRQLPIFQAFAEWVKAPGKGEEKPQVYTVVQANIKDMLNTFKQYTENRNRVILDRRAKAEKDAKAAEEAKKKANGEDIEGRLKKIEAGIFDLSSCVNGNGSKELNVNMSYA